MHNLKRALPLAWALSALLLLPVMAGAKTTIVHWQHSSAGRDQMMQTLAREFMELHPDVEVVVEVFPLGEFLNKILVSLAGGAGPDTVQVRSDWVSWLQSTGMLQPLSEAIIDADTMERLFVPAPIQPLKGPDGLYYGLPTDTQTVVLFYHPSIFEEAGLDSSRPPQTWEDTISAARRMTIHDSDGIMRRMGLATGGYEPVIVSFMIQAGADLWDEERQVPVLNSPEAVKGLMYATDMITEYRVEDPAFSSRWTAFRNETLGMVYAHPAMMGSFYSTHPDLGFAITEIPAPEVDGSQESLTTSWGLSVTNLAQDTELATEWLMYVQSEEAQMRWFEATGELPTRYSVIQLPEYRTNPLYEPIMWSLVRGQPRPWISDDVYPAIRRAWNAIYKGELAPVAAIETMQLEAEIAETATRAERLGD